MKNMKNFEAKLASIQEDLELQKALAEDSGRPAFANDNISFILAGIYDHIVSVLKYDPDHEDIVSDLFAQFRQMKSTIERRHKELASETKTAPDGHYYTKTGNLVKGRLSKDAEERGARLSDPKDKQRSKTPAVSQYNEEELGGEGTFIIDLDRDQLIVSIDDVEERITGIKSKNFDTGEMDEPSAGFVRSRLQSLLAKMGYDVGTPGTDDGPGNPGTYNVNIIWAKDNPGQDIDKFQLVPRDLAKFN